MKRRLWGMVVVVSCFMLYGSAFAAGLSQCTHAVKRIKAVYKQGDFPIAKLLVDHAIADVRALGCNGEQCEQLKQLREDVYLAYIVERLSLTKTNLLEHGDGFAALRAIAQVNEMAETIKVELKGIDQLCGAAFFTAACQNIEAAKEIEQSGEPELGAALRKQAKEFIDWACAFDPRIKKILKETISKK